MKYEVKAKVVIKVIVDADDQNVAVEMVEKALSDTYDTYYEIETVDEVKNDSNM